MGFRHALMRLLSAEQDYTRFIEHHGGNLLRRASDYERYLDELDDEWLIRLPSGMTLHEGDMHSLLVNITRDLPRGGVWEQHHEFIVLPVYGDDLVKLLSARLALGLPAGWEVQVRHCDSEGRDVYGVESVCTGKRVTLR